VAFCKDGVITNGTKSALEYCEKIEKKYVILDWIYIYIWVMKEDKLTSVKVIDELYRKFREKSIRDDFSLQKLVNRTLDMFVYDEEFQKKVLEYDNLEKSGSKY